MPRNCSTSGDGPLPHGGENFPRFKLVVTLLPLSPSVLTRGNIFGQNPTNSTFGCEKRDFQVVVDSEG